jgi:NADPH-dependent 2,4-dienoyl-CoA reductase/sulfur reductase-like enzyme
MPEYTYLIVGGGMTADAAVRGIREVDGAGTIGLIGAEPDAPYNRPPLTKGLWKGDPYDSIWRHTEQQHVALHLGREVTLVDPQQKRVVDDQGTVYTYGKLLLATGGTPRRLPFGGDDVLYYRTVADYRRLRALTEQFRRFAVIGGGFIGSEIAAALAMNGKQVVLIFPDATIGARVFPREHGEFLNRFYQEKGVEVAAGESVVGLDRSGVQWRVRTRGQSAAREGSIEVDAVVAGLGIQPNVALAQQAGLDVGNGVIVDAQLRTSNTDVYAAGDVASFPNPALGERIRIEHEDNANTMGTLAGRNMAASMTGVPGGGGQYDHLPYFYSDLFDLGYEAVGNLDARLQTVVDWKDPHREGVIYYLHGGRVRGVLLWNVWEQVDAARRLIAEAGPFRPEDLTGRLPAAH